MTTTTTHKRDEQFLAIAQNEMNETWGEGTLETLNTTHHAASPSPATHDAGVSPASAPSQ